MHKIRKLYLHVDTISDAYQIQNGDLTNACVGRNIISITEKLINS
jgi:hypothetical protein